MDTDALDLRQLLTLHSKAEDFFDRVVESHGDHLECRKGCSACCHQSLCLFPVELARLERAVAQLPDGVRENIAAGLGGELDGDDAQCPLLFEDSCLVYEDRPTICRTHGAPILIRPEETEPDQTERRDVCPLNFAGDVSLEDLPRESLLDLDRLNALLALTNRLTLAQAGLIQPREPLRAALARWLESGSPDEPST